jgi:hypothetical protein
VATEPGACERARSRRWLLAIAALAWLVSSVLLAPELGKYSDDYAVVMRDLATGELDLSTHDAQPWVRWPYFWRPLHLAFIYLLGTLLWYHDWLLHVISALAHAACAGLLFQLLRRLRIDLWPAGLAAIAFMTFPLGAEAVLWFSACAGVLGSIVLLVVLNVVARWSISDQPLTPRRLSVVLMGSFACACLYEMSAAALVAAPLVVLAARLRPPQSQTRRPDIRRALLVAAALGLGCGLYAALLLSTAPDWQRGSPQSLASPRSLTLRALSLVREAPDWLLGVRARDLWLGALIDARHAVATLRIRHVLLLIGIALGSAAGLALIEHRDQRSAGIQPDPPVGPEHPERASPALALIAVIGSTITLVSWLPVLLVPANSLELRLWYTPLVGLAAVFAALLSIEPLRRAGLPQVLSRAIALTLILAGSLAMFGLQHRFRSVHERDQLQLRSLQAVLPSPPVGSIVLPLRSLDTGAATGRDFYDHAVAGGFSQPWSSWAMIRAGYRRRDLFATHIRPPVGRGLPAAPPLHGFSAEGVWSTINLTIDLPRGPLGTFVPWDRAIPIGIMPDGSLQFFDQINIERPDGDDLIVMPTITRTLRDVEPERVRPITLVDSADLHAVDRSTRGSSPGHWRSPGTIETTTESLPGKRRWHAGIQRDTVECALDSGSLALVFDSPLARPQTLLTRWSVITRGQSPADSDTTAPSASILARIDDAPPIVITTRSIDQVTQSRRWHPLLVPLPAGTRRLELRVLTANPGQTASLTPVPGPDGDRPAGYTVLFTPPTWTSPRAPHDE